ncbi:MAG: hypothetical protein IJA08_03130 [Clostridia bacterium]|nr:hypothetical protein [Clostridia bacterium]
MSYRKIIAADFDGVLNLNSIYPKLGEPNIELIKKLNKWQDYGNKIILWTCREGQFLDDAVKFCKTHGLYPDAINDNIPETVDYFGSNSRKVYADYYIDDKAITPAEIDKISACQETTIL